MANLFAFDVAVTEPETDSSLGYYDPERQQFVWEGTGEVILGSAVCTRVTVGYHSCTGGGTTCRLYAGRCLADGGIPVCYTCDYG